MRIFGYEIATSRHKKAAPDRPPTQHWTPTHMHKKGGAYRYLNDGILEADRSAVVIYDDRDGRVWVRPHDEFHDGRFSPLT
jgi:hypothetical protein|tara:strand:- start:598 stop:840 length:243 start_codon:yes stop_codon:yes gene_type:complete